MVTTEAFNPTLVVWQNYDDYRLNHSVTDENRHTEVALTYMKPPFDDIWFFTSYSNVPRRTILRKLHEMPIEKVTVFYEGTPGGAGINLSLIRREDRPKTVGFSNIWFDGTDDTLKFESGYWIWKKKVSLPISSAFIHVGEGVSGIVWSIYYDKVQNQLHFILNRS